MQVMDEKDWRRVLDMNRAMREAEAQAEMAEMMTRQKSEYLVDEPTDGNRHQRRMLARRNRHADRR
jgi:hypothetical protein